MVANGKALCYNKINTMAESLKLIRREGCIRAIIAYPWTTAVV